MQSLVGESQEFENNTLSHWKPVETVEYRSDVITFSTTGEPSRSFLNMLSFVMVVDGRP